MLEKKQLNDEELEKISGGYHMVDDPLIGKTINLKYHKLTTKTFNIKALVLDAAVLDGYYSGFKIYKLNVDNGYAVGWFDGRYITDPDGAFYCKDSIKTSCLSLEEFSSWESEDPNDPKNWDIY